MIVSIDPGVHECGVAVWFGCELHRALLVREGAPGQPSWVPVVDAVADALLSYNVKEIVIERPQVYERSRSKGDPNDLIALALVAGAVVGAVREYQAMSMCRIVGYTPCRVIEYRPADWKGQVPKDVMVRRIKRSLAKTELERVELPKAKSLAHNVWDAVGIGLHHLRKYRRQDVD